MSTRLSALLQAIGVTLVWAASFVLIKIGLEGAEGIPPLTFAGLRYTIAFLCLLAFILRSPIPRRQVVRLTGTQWRSLIALGLVYYAVSQGAQFAALEVLPSVTLSLILNFTPIAVALFAAFGLNERPTRQQVVGIVGFLAGVLIYFADEDIPPIQAAGLAIGVACMFANAIGSVMGRGINRQLALLPLTVTVVSMGIGAATLLVTGLLTEGMPALTPTHWAIIVWLAVVHTALTFVTWNRALRHLSAIEASLINSLMLVYIAILAWQFLGEAIMPQGVVGLVFAVAGVILVQVRWR